MREIKFRAWDGMEWVYSSAVDYVEIENTWRIFDQLNEEWLYCLQPYQYTGLKDKNGNEIYEGDIVHFTVFDCFDNDKQFKGVVKFAEGQWQIWNSTKSEYYGSDGAFDLWCVNQQDDEFETIGNVYENPELLEESQNGTK